MTCVLSNAYSVYMCVCSQTHIYLDDNCLFQNETFVLLFEI
jgi:hypothetical protein